MSKITKAYLFVATAMVATLIPVAADGQAAPARQARAVFLSVTPPEAKVASQIVSPEGDVAIMSVPDLGKFGFRPKIINDTRVSVAILDLRSEASKELGTIELELGQRASLSKTTPAFALQLLRVSPK